MYDQIVVPTDGSEGTRGAVEHAIDLATTYDAVSILRSPERSMPSKKLVRTRSMR